MSFKDILTVSVENLKRRKGRTILSAIGVMIGTISVVMMLSIGIGLQDLNEKEINSMIDLQSVLVQYNGNERSKFLTDSKKSQFEELDFVERVDGELVGGLVVDNNEYSGYMTVYATTKERIAEVPLVVGEAIDYESNPVQFIAGNTLNQQLWDKKKQCYPYYDSKELPDVDFMKDEFIFTSPKRILSDNGEDYEMIPMHNVEIVGVTEGDEYSYEWYSYNLVTDVESYRKFLKENYTDYGTIEGQPRDKNGKPLNEIAYNMFQVKIKDVEQVEAATRYFRDMGYEVENSLEILEENKKSFRLIQIGFFAIGAISLLVAGIGIANTITMSVQERKKEIGVMKVIGCDIDSIGYMFVTEAGFVGFLGGIIGIIISYIISFVTNRLTADMIAGSFSVEGSISVIPPWLILVSVAFSVMVGVIAGYVPSKNATKISALEAIRNN